MNTNLRKRKGLEYIGDSQLNFDGPKTLQIDDNSTAAAVASEGDVYQPPPVVTWQPDQYTHQARNSCISDFVDVYLNLLKL